MLPCLLVNVWKQLEGFCKNIWIANPNNLIFLICSYNAARPQYPLCDFLKQAYAYLSVFRLAVNDRWETRRIFCLQPECDSTASS
jgi:hypothetical protein